MKKLINKTKGFLLIIIFSTIFLNIQNISCKLDVKPKDVVSPNDQFKTFSGFQNATNGVYANLASYSYYRFFHVLSEYSSDDVVWDNTSSDPAWFIFDYSQTTSNYITLTFWKQAYYAIFAANSVITRIKDGVSPIQDATSQQTDLLKGENLFIRAMVNFDLARLYCKPYVQDSLGDKGIVIRDSTLFQDSPKRSTVKQTYDFIINDLLHAIKLLDQPDQFKSASYATKYAAFGLLSRVYLYMNRNSLAVAYADSVISSDNYQLLTGSDYSIYFTKNPDQNKETIFAIHRTENQDLGAGTAELGDLYNTLNGGYGEIHPSNTYLPLLGKNSEDSRLKFVGPEYATDDSGNQIPLDPQSDDTLSIEYQSGYKFKISYNRNYPQIDILKYSNQEGFATLASPVILRLAEMYLNRAEANAKLGNLQPALDDINKIRKRAGIIKSTKLYTLGNLLGKATVLEAVLEERRLELAWECHRKFDVFRNNLPMDRTYLGSQQKITIQPDDPLTVQPIPLNEISLNANLVQNPGY